PSWFSRPSFAWPRVLLSGNGMGGGFGFLVPKHPQRFQDGRISRPLDQGGLQFFFGLVPMAPPHQEASQLVMKVEGGITIQGFPKGTGLVLVMVLGVVEIEELGLLLPITGSEKGILEHPTRGLFKERPGFLIAAGFADIVDGQAQAAEIMVGGPPP